MLKKIFSISVSFLFVISTSLPAQQLGLHFMEDVWQVNHTNPAKAPDQKVIWSFPNVYGNFTHSAFSFNNLTTTNSEGLQVLDSRQLIANLEDRNFFNLQTSAETFNLAISVLNMQFSLHHAIKFNGSISYPKTLAQFIFEGNAPFIGQSLEIAPSFNLTAYNEIGLGFNVRLAKLHIGGRLKALTGLANLSSDMASIQLQTDEDIYQLNLTSDYLINAAGGVGLDFDATNFDPQFDIDNYSIADMLKINRGWGIDLGATFQVNDRLNVAASIIDLGFIKWSENATNLTSQGSYSFEGFDIDDFINEEGVEFQTNVDSLYDIFNFVSTNNSFTTYLPAKIYLSATYKVAPIFRAGGLLYLENQRGKTYKAIALNGTLHLGRIFSLGAVYSIYNRSFSNIGLNFQLKLGPVQFFGASDNVLAALRPTDSRGTNGRIGLNLVFGKRGVKLPVVGD